MYKTITIFLCIAFNSAVAQDKISVITQHNDLYRSGWNKNETLLTPANVASSSFGVIGSIPVDDQVYTQPLIVKNLTINNFTGSVVFVATVNNTVYAFNADDPTNTAALWQVNLNPAGQRTPAVPDLNDPVYLRPCGGTFRDFTKNFGIVGTPAIDTISNTLYVVNKTIDGSGNFSHYLNALDITTGMHKPGSPKKITASVNGTGDGSVNGVLSFESKYANQRPALLLHNGVVYIATASYCDWGPYHGWLLGYNANTLDLQYTYNTTPNGWAGGIWMAGQGISVGDDGNLYVVTGNGTTSPDNNNMVDGRSESLIKLTPQLQVLDWFTPANYEYLDIEDLDYGCDGVLLIPNSPLTISGSKEGISYVVDYNNLGRLTPGNTQVKDTLVFNPFRTGYVHVHGSPAYAKQGNEEYVYGWSESYKLRQFQLDRNTNTFFSNFREGNRTLDYGMPGAMLSISSNGTDTSSGLLWACFPTTGNANHEVRPGTLAVYKAANVAAGEIWNSDLHLADTVGSFAKFNCATIANGKVYVPTFSNELRIYGLKCTSAPDTFTYGNGTGLKGEYYSNSISATFDNDIPAVVRIDNKIAFNWGSGSPDTAISNDLFKARWTGKLRPLSNDNYTFYITASDGVRLYIDNQLIIDSWTDKINTVNTAQFTLQKNIDYDIRLEYYSNANPANCILQWSATDICRQNIPPSQLFWSPVNCGSNGTGVKAEYFTNSTSATGFPATATLTNTAPTINFDWKNGSPDSTTISVNNFKARFTGYVQTLNAGVYNFYITADDGVRMWINDQLVVDAWINQAPTEYRVYLPLKGCTKYSIRIEYYEGTGNAQCKLAWSGPLFTKTIVPTTQLSTELDTNMWLGITSDWNTGSNWSKGTVPDAYTDAVISTGVPFMPVVTGTNNTTRSLKLNQGASIDVVPGAILNILKQQQ